MKLLRFWVAYQIAKLYQVVATGHFGRDHVAVPTRFSLDSLPGFLAVLSRAVDPTKAGKDCFNVAMLLAIKDRVCPSLSLEEYFKQLKQEQE